MQMQDNVVIRLVYTFFLGVLIALFVGVGVNTFYVEPTYPEMPTSLKYGGEMTAAMQKDQAAFDAKNNEYQTQIKAYNRNVSIITLAVAVLLVVVSFAFEKRVHILANGVMLGGLMTLIYSLGRSFGSEDSKYIFAATTVGLIVVLFLGYKRFAGVQQPESATKKQ